jgi:HK97 family phage major capsid protein
VKPRLYENLLQGQSRYLQEQKLAYEQLKQKAEQPFLKRYIQMGLKESLFSDASGALGRMHDTVVQNAWPELIGRNIITVRPTTETLERFPLDEGAVAYKYAEGATTRLSGKKSSTVDICTDQLAESSDEWTKEYLEDATWNVMDNALANVGAALGQDETENIIALYTGITSGDLATGTELSAGNAAMSWAQLLNLHNAVRSQNWRPTVLAINEMQLHQLLNDDKFVHAQYLPSSQTDVEQGLITSVLGMKVQASTLVPNGTALAIDTRVASVMLLRRDITVEDWDDVKTGKYGIRATTRFGIGVLRSNAVARMTNIKTTLT